MQLGDLTSKNTLEIATLLDQILIPCGRFGLVFCLMSRSTIFQSFWDGATASWVFTSTLGTLKCLAQGHYMAVMGFEPWTSRGRETWQFTKGSL